MAWWIFENNGQNFWEILERIIGKFIIKSTDLTHEYITEYILQFTLFLKPLK